MDDSEKLQNIIDDNKQLVEKVDELSRAINEDANAYSIYSKAKDNIKSWIGMWIGFLVLFFSGIGVTSYYKAVELLSNSEVVTSRLIEKLSPTIEKAILDELKKKIDELKKRIDKQLRENSVVLEELLANTKAQAKSRIENIQNQLNLQLMSIGDKNKITPIKIESYPVEAGYAFYGIRLNNNWNPRYFKVLEDASAEPPKVGDSLEALSNVNIRKDYITFGVTGWSNAPTLGVIIPGDTLDVLEVKEVVNGYYWIKFNNRKHNK